MKLEQLMAELAAVRARVGEGPELVVLPSHDADYRGPNGEKDGGRFLVFIGDDEVPCAEIGDVVRESEL